MSEETLSKEKIDLMMKLASSKLKIPPERIREQLEAGAFHDLINRINQKNSSQDLQQLLSNPKAMEQLLDTPKVKEMLHNLMEEK